jgi:hypothetical protein
MKMKPMVFGICIVVVIALAIAVLIVTKMKKSLDTSFATSISLKYYYADKTIDIQITDKQDIEIIKDNLNGLLYSDNPSCGFSLDISICFTDGESNVVICPACDSCSTARIGDSDMYINIKDRKALNTVLEKYGLMFPCV